jgi:CyaY protein
LAAGSEQGERQADCQAGQHAAPFQEAVLAACSGRRHYTDGIEFGHADILPIMTSQPLTDADYHRLTSQVLAAIEAQADGWLEDDVIDIDSHRTGGLLELSFPNGSKIIVNTQPPLQELWLAARAGGYHYRFEADRWIDTRQGGEFFEDLSRQATAQAGIPLRFEAAVG